MQVVHDRSKSWHRMLQLVASSPGGVPERDLPCVETKKASPTSCTKVGEALINSGTLQLPSTVYSCDRVWRQAGQNILGSVLRWVGSLVWVVHVPVREVHIYRQMLRALGLAHATSSARANRGWRKVRGRNNEQDALMRLGC